MINQLLQVLNSFEQAGYPLKGDFDPRIRWEKGKGKLCRFIQNGEIEISDLPENQFVHFVVENNQNIYYRLKIGKKSSDVSIKKAIKSSVNFCQQQKIRIGNNDPSYENFDKLLNGFQRIDPNDLIAKVGEIKEDCFVYFELDLPFVQTEQMVQISSEHLDYEAAKSRIIVDALGENGHEIKLLPPLSRIAKGYDTKIFARNKDIPGLKRFGKNSLETFPLTHQSSKKILGFAKELFSFENRYKVSDEGVPHGFYAVRQSDARVFVIVSTINASFLTLSLGHKYYEELAAKALASYVDQDSYDSLASGNLFIIEWNDAEAPCVRLSQTISYKEGYDLANQWFKDVKSGIQHPSTWNSSADPEKPGGHGGGLTVLSLLQVINSKWRVSKDKIDFTEKNNISIQDCYSLYLGNQSVVSKLIRAFIASRSPIAMLQESGMFSVLGRSRDIHPALKNQLYPLNNLLIARELRAQGNNMNQQDHWAFKVGRLCNTLSWMQSLSYELRDMDTTVRPIGLNIVSLAYVSPTKAMARLVTRSISIRKTLERIAIRESDEESKRKARKAINTFDKQYNELSEMLVNIPLKTSPLDKMIMTSGFCYKNYSASSSVTSNSQEPLENVNS